MNGSLRGSIAVGLVFSLWGSQALADDPAAPAPPAATKHELATASVPQTSPAPSPIPAPTPEEIRRRRVVVRIDSSRPSAVVERRVSVKEEIGAFLVLPFRATDAIWEQICVTPCEVDLDRFSTYRVSAQNHISRSAPFTLPQKADALHLNVDARSLAVHRTGETFSVIGIAALIVGGSLLVAASDFKHPNDARIAGGATGGAGVALAAVGIPLALTSISHIDTEDGRELAKVYKNHGYALPFLPDIKLSKTMTLTQRGITF
jgi:hypothetical protein